MTMLLSIALRTGLLLQFSVLSFFCLIVSSAPPPVHFPKPVLVPPTEFDCNYDTYSRFHHEPYSEGKRQLPSQRPPKECRSYVVQEVEDAVIKYKSVIEDPDLFKLFENSFPNTLDTAVKWTGYAQDEDGLETDEELAFIITGDMYVPPI